MTRYISNNTTTNQIQETAKTDLNHQSLADLPALIEGNASIEWERQTLCTANITFVHFTGNCDGINLTLTLWRDVSLNATRYGLRIQDIPEIQSGDRVQQLFELVQQRHQAQYEQA